jgi:hypothetical protein
VALSDSRRATDSLWTIEHATWVQQGAAILRISTVGTTVTTRVCGSFCGKGSQGNAAYDWLIPVKNVTVGKSIWCASGKCASRSIAPGVDALTFNYRLQRYISASQMLRNAAQVY